MLSVVYTTAPRKNALELARALVERKLAGCVNVNVYDIDISSVYWWGDKVEEDEKSGLLIKTTPELVEDVVKVLKELHLYEIPVILCWDVEAKMDYEKLLRGVVVNGEERD
ncbi:divalent-cation tolerance protein CutA [Methanosarcinales archaeon]|nr:MAG: divalent-cation tolerance protein CutA [Methanosarcinales archaeon]